MYSIRNYGEMILDEPRMAAYVRALRQHVKPGCVVADLGTGTGIFALLACRFGARRVFAIEPSETIAVAREIAAANDCPIEFFQAMSTEVSLPERADVIVSDLRGILPLFQRHIPSVVDARRRLLAPRGVMIPRSDRLWAAVVEAPEAHRRIVAPWMQNEFGLDMRRAARVVANNFTRLQAKADQLLTSPQCMATIDYTAIEDPDLSASAQFVATRNGTAHGVCAWFDSVLADDVTLSNAPGEPELIYGNAFFPWPEPVEVAAGDEVELRLRADLVGQDYVWTWDSRVSRAGSAGPRFHQSEFFGEVVSPATLKKRGAGYVPALSEDGEIERMVLERMDGRTTLAEIARAVAERHPRRFANWEAALAHVAGICERSSR